MSINYTDIFKDPSKLDVETVWKICASNFFANKSISPTQYAEMRKAFYTGFIECFNIMSDFAVVIPEDDAAALYGRLVSECNKFFDSDLAAMIPKRKTEDCMS